MMFLWLTKEISIQRTWNASFDIFFQENCSQVIDQLRGQRLQRLVALARAQEHNLEYTSFHSGNSIR